MSAMSPVALIMRERVTESQKTAAALRGLGFAVTECGDEAHLYAEAMRFAIIPDGARPALLIVTEPTGAVVRDLEMLRTARWRTPFVLVGHAASRDTAARLHAACLPCEEPTAEALQQAIQEARSVFELHDRVPPARRRGSAQLTRSASGGRQSRRSR